MVMLSSLKDPVLNQVGSCLKFYLSVIVAVYTEVKGGSTRKFNCPFQLGENIPICVTAGLEG